MTGFLVILLSVCGIVFHGDGLAFRQIPSKYQTRDDFYEDFYLRKIPKLKASPDKVKQFFLNHLSWFSANDRGESFPPFGKTDESQSTPADGADESSCETRQNRTVRAHNSTQVPRRSGPARKVKNFLNSERFKVLLKNVTRSFAYSGLRTEPRPVPEPQDYKSLSMSVRIRPKNSSTSAPPAASKAPDLLVPVPKENHIPYPRKIKVIIDLTEPEKATNDNSYPNVEGDGSNSSTVLETAGEMASDLAGRVTSLWHSVLGTHHSPDTRDVRFFLYTRRNVIQPELLKVNYDLISKKMKSILNQVELECTDLGPDDIGEFERISDENREIIRSNFFNVNAPTKILIHGYTGSYRDTRMAKIKDAYLASGRYNVIQVDWEMLAAPPCYIRVTQHSKFVGETISQFLSGLYLAGVNMSLVHLVGFSLGAQVAGFAGNNSTLVPVCRITGLDPALPLFLHTQPSGHLDKLDAKFVDVIHTCGGILAMLDPLGHVDFYPNGGTKQPGCEFSNLKCSHSRAPQYFAESVVSEKRFTGQFCFSWEEYVAGECNNYTAVSFMGEPCSRRSVSGKYYLITKSKEPFVL